MNERRRVYILARKILKNNSRIFKQAKSLVEAGYDVKLIGIKAEGLEAHQEMDGYTITRISLNPLQVKINSLIQRKTAMKRKLPMFPIFILTTLFSVIYHRSYRFFRLGKVKWWLKSQRIRLWRRTRRFLKLAKVIWWLKSRRIRLWHRIYRFLRLAKVRWWLKSRRIRFWRRIYRFLKLAKVRWWLKSRRIRLGRRIRQGRLTKTYNYINNSFYGMFRAIIKNLRWLFNSWDYYSKTYRLVMNDSTRPDIVHANDLDTLAVAFLISARTNAKLVYDAQELYTGIHTLPGWYKVLMSVQEFFLIRSADKVTVVNDAIARKMEKKYIIKVNEVILNCPHYYDCYSKKHTISVREKLGIDHSIPVYLYSGGLVSKRGIENTILSLKYLPKGALVILGEGRFKEELINIIDKEHLEARVYFSDFVPYGQVSEFISSADVGILPYENVGINHYLCSPSKLFHYIMAELPVACSDFPFLKKVVLDDDLGATFDPGNPRSIARSIDSIISSKKRYREIKSNLLQAKRKYCWENEEQKFIKVYRDLLS
ncbi:glycosyltransferase [Chloroflexota bacterium]